MVSTTAPSPESAWGSSGGKTRGGITVNVCMMETPLGNTDNRRFGGDVTAVWDELNNSAEVEEIPVTMVRKDVGTSGVILHCGQCAACSNLHDMEVIYRTRNDITTHMTKCASDFAKPKIFGGHQNLQKLRSCLIDAGINFSTDQRSWKIDERHSKPSCMDCWTDNIQCDSVNCKLEPDCIKKFFDPTNSGKFEGCLKCDETKCGPEFIKCAGSNRRSTGIISDIEKGSSQVCPVGYYYHK
eukprot:Nk52_evm69s2367 gene=Nk52_evmTU69s2367